VNAATNPSSVLPLTGSSTTRARSTRACSMAIVTLPSSFRSSRKIGMMAARTRTPRASRTTRCSGSRTTKRSTTALEALRCEISPTWKSPRNVRSSSATSARASTRLPGGDVT
jgi:hypothetical protein